MSIFGDNGFGIIDRFQSGGGQSQITNSPLFNTALGRPAALPNPQDRGMVDPRPFAASPRPYSPQRNVLTGDPIGMRSKSLNTPLQNKLAQQARFIKQQTAYGIRPFTPTNKPAIGAGQQKFAGNNLESLGYKGLGSGYAIIGPKGRANMDKAIAASSMSGISRVNENA